MSILLTNKNQASIHNNKAKTHQTGTFFWNTSFNTYMVHCEFVFAKSKEKKMNIFFDGTKTTKVQKKTSPNKDQASHSQPHNMMFMFDATIDDFPLDNH